MIAKLSEYHDSHELRGEERTELLEIDGVWGVLPPHQQVHLISRHRVPDTRQVMPKGGRRNQA